MPDIKAARRAVTLTYSRHNRRRKAAFALDFAKRHDVRTVLLVGVSQFNVPHENIVERSLMQAGLVITPTGVADAEIVEGWDGYMVADGCDLPFEDGSFDLVYSNAVIEHVGGKDRQQAFVDEHARVGRHFILTTPNKWFPVEAHTDTLFRHWAPGWHDERGSVTRLLGPTKLRELLPQGAKIHGQPLAPTLAATR